MATISHTIYSYYSPKKPESLATPPSHAHDESADPWETEPSSFSETRRSLMAPRFVPATMSHENAGSRQPHMVDNDDVGASLAGWYRSLTGTQCTVDRPSLAVQSRTVAGPSKPSVDIQEPLKRRAEARNKNNWFILRAIESESSSGSLIPSPAPTLADILARDPPPIEGGYSPPVWLALGPSNKGFTMLQQRGWNEGEGLGPRVRRRRRIEADFLDAEEPFEMKSRLEARRLAVKKEEREVKWEEDVQEIRNIDVIDLTLSDSEDDVHESDADTPGDPPDPLDPSHSPRALLTPIATVLKSDRLGIGLKAKTVGPYKASQKRVTHNAATLTAHIKAAEDLRRKKATIGRGRRGFAKMAQKEQERRQKMLAYLNE
ncbi:hypothetical protein PILCRDRAFT_813009 [Piloderma croceum F 1598]|uniref:G-patch domain-containing protein n=1 Tax=Piloderma croceum (strain F 1598) TaxID=765440 RepID=A0A0C3FY51_PILCF|nr:hypothetical protein PILCRDRAFT_813009 [Piloderma croceum F 1598]